MNFVFYNAALACAFAVLLGPTWTSPQEPPLQHALTPAQVAAWREDLAYMAREMARRHRNLYHTVSRERFDSAVAALNRRIPRLERHQIIVELARIVALVGDGHTNIAPTRDSAIGFRTLPIKLYFFRDGLFIRAADRQHGNLTGAKVIRIGQATPEEGYRRVRALIGQDNEMDARFFAPFLLATPEVLHALHLSTQRDSADFIIERDGRQSTVRLGPLGPVTLMPSDTDVSWWADSGWVDMRSPREPAPLWLRRNPHDEYWLEYLPDRQLVYLQFNKVGDKEGESLEEFSNRLLALLDTADVRRVALDLRLNRGGNGSLNRPLVRTLIQARRLDHAGSLFVLIGRSTFSAAQFLVNELEHYTDALFVGEPSGGKANSYGDSRKITLPHSGITVRVSTLWWQVDERDKRQWKSPDIAAELTSSDYRNNVDPALQAVLDYRAEPSVSDQMAAALDSGDLSEALHRYRSYRADPKRRYVDTEEELNSLAYRLLHEKRMDQAIAIFELNAAEHPRSSNVWDSLGEACLLVGRREAAIQHYRKSLELDPSNENARSVLAQLRI
ncbi:MAG: tetratricopeptide repeat protein [Gemmatimonadales bacterium]